jgi:hypothetical protein
MGVSSMVPTRSRVSKKSRGVVLGVLILQLSLH